jgi:hypothetical protein
LSNAGPMRIHNVGITIGIPKYPGKRSLLVGTLCLVGIYGSRLVRMYPSGRIPTHPFRGLGLLARGNFQTDVGLCKYQGRTAV